MGVGEDQSEGEHEGEDEELDLDSEESYFWARFDSPVPLQVAGGPKLTGCTLYWSHILGHELIGAKGLRCVLFDKQERPFPATQTCEASAESRIVSKAKPFVVPVELGGPTNTEVAPS